MFGDEQQHIKSPTGAKWWSLHDLVYSITLYTASQFS